MTKTGQEKEETANAGNLLKVSDIMKLTGFSRNYVYSLTSKKMIPHYKIMGSVRFKRSEVMEWIEKNKVEVWA